MMTYNPLGYCSGTPPIWATLGLKHNQQCLHFRGGIVELMKVSLILVSCGEISTLLTTAVALILATHLAT